MAYVVAVVASSQGSHISKQGIEIRIKDLQINKFKKIFIYIYIAHAKGKVLKV